MRKTKSIRLQVSWQPGFMHDKSEDFFHIFWWNDVIFYKFTSWVWYNVRYLCFQLSRLMWQKVNNDDDGKHSSIKQSKWDCVHRTDQNHLFRFALFSHFSLIFWIYFLHLLSSFARLLLAVVSRNISTILLNFPEVNRFLIFLQCTRCMRYDVWQWIPW